MRDCVNCIHKKGNGCEKWDCEFEPRDVYGCDSINRQVAIEGVVKSCIGKTNVVQAEAAIIQYLHRIPASNVENYERLRKRFIKRMTEDSNTQDRRRKDFNQAIFGFNEDGSTYQCFCETDMGMVLQCFDDAIDDLKKEDRFQRNRRN